MELLSTHSCICYRGWLVSEALGLLKLAEDVGNWASTSASITPAEPSVEPTGRNLNATQLKTGFVDHRRWQETGHLYFLVSDPVWLCVCFQCCFLFQPHAAILRLSNYIILFCFFNQFSLVSLHSASYCCPALRSALFNRSLWINHDMIWDQYLLIFYTLNCF